jgi:DNA-binding LacI/PurR family transcriptional regulator
MNCSATDAVLAAMRRIDQPALAPSVSVVEPRLVVRGSTARPRRD